LIQVDQDEQDELDEQDDIGAQALDRISRALGGCIVLPLVFKKVPGMLGGTWTQRYAGLLSIASIAEGAADILKQELYHIVKYVSVLMQGLCCRFSRMRFVHC
jgi:hypothetical protein